MRLGINADDRLGVGFAQMHPAILEIDLNTVDIIHALIGIAALYIDQNFIYVGSRRKPFAHLAR